MNIFTFVINNDAKLKNYSLLISKMKRYFKLFGLISVFLVLSLNTLSQRNRNNGSAIKTVCIDAGHGGKDP
ncbi:MAG: hypothetical protein ACK48V_02095, partial [Crocinitomicaceae bacterium]